VVTLLFCIRKVPGSNPGRDTDYLDSFRGLTQSLQANAGIVRSIKPQLIPSTFCSIHDLNIRRYTVLLTDSTHICGGTR
jgi:hypothetical protein